MPPLTRLIAQPMCCANRDLEDSPLALALQAAPVAVSVGAGVPLFNAIYLPLLLLARGAEASRAAVLLFSTLLFAASSGLIDTQPASSPLVATAANVALACALGWTEVQRAAQAEIAPEEESPFTSFDRRLKEASKARQRRRGGDTRMCAEGNGDTDAVEPGESTEPSTFDFTGMGEAFEGRRVLDMRARALDRETRQRATPSVVLANMRENPGTAVLIVLFGLLTVGDFIFNVSRTFICLLPDLCEPV